MPSFGDWLTASWADYKRRWVTVLAVAGVTGAATLLGGFIPILPAGIVSLAGVGSPWVVWGVATTVSLLAVLYLSTWGQAAVTRAALTDEPAGDCLAIGWKLTDPFAWVLTLTLLATMGGFFLLVFPGLILSVLLFLAPFTAASGEASGLRALELCWGRARPRFGLVAGRLFAASALAAAPGYIPYVGWLIAMFWTPFGVLALARLEKDLRAADPEPAAPKLGALVTGLSAVFLIGMVGFTYAATRAVTEMVKNFNEPGGLASRVDPAAAQAYMDAMARGDEEGKKKALADLLSGLRKP